MNRSLTMPKPKILCANCQLPTSFGESAEHERVVLGWCGPCFKHSRRTFVDKVSGETRSLDELRTVDGSSAGKARSWVAGAAQPMAHKPSGKS